MNYLSLLNAGTLNFCYFLNQNQLFESHTSKMVNPVHWLMLVEYQLNTSKKTVKQSWDSEHIYVCFQVIFEKFDYDYYFVKVGLNLKLVFLRVHQQDYNLWNNLLGS